MQANHFGQMLIIIGAFVALVMLFLADWSVQLGFMQNIRYAELYCSERATFGPYCAADALDVRLGQGLIFPLALMSIGLMIIRKIISERLLSKLLPFIKSSDDDSASE